MKNNILRKAFPVLMVLCLIFSFALNITSARASETSDTIRHVYDDAKLLSSAEASDIEDKCISYGKDAGINIFILTHDDSSAVDGEIYIENFFDTNLKGTYDDSVILLVDMANRDVVLEGYGTAETYIHSQRGDVIIDKISPYLTDEKYADAFEIYIERSAAYMKDKSDPNYSRNYTTAPETRDTASAEDTILTNIWFQLLVAAAIGAISVGIMAYNAGGRMTAGGGTYMDQNNSGLIGRRDDYIRTTVTRIRKPENNNSNGGFHGGISAGGSSHSTSRGKF
jgi:uncharacterized protein